MRHRVRSSTHSVFARTCSICRIVRFSRRGSLAVSSSAAYATNGGRAVSSRWQGKCDECGGWNTLVEEAMAGGIGGGPAVRTPRKGRVVALSSLAGDTADPPRVKSGIAEFDRVTGGGFVPGSALLVGG